MQTNRLLDAEGRPFLLRGAVAPAIESPAFGGIAADLPPALEHERGAPAGQHRALARDGQPYLDTIASAVETANRESLVAVVAAFGDTPLPDADAPAFWRAAAQQLRASPARPSLYGEPRTSDWATWAAALQPLADAIRGTGATQVIAAPGRAGIGFQGIPRESFLRDPNVLYEIQSLAATDVSRDSAFGFLANDAPLSVGPWSVACESATVDTLVAALFYLDRHNASWTAETGACKVVDDALVLWLTGDPAGFGSIDSTQIASAAGGFPGPVAPGEILSLYGQGIGPDPAVGARLVDGRVPSSLGEVQAIFDGLAAPVLLASYFQVNVQVPYEVAGRSKIKLRLLYRDVPSNEVELEVAAAVPEIFTASANPSEALALNQDGTLNGPSNSAARGSIVSFFVTGEGQTDPPRATGVPALAAGSLRASVTIAGRSAEILYAGPAPTLVGVAQINARIPADVPSGTRRAPVVLTIGGGASAPAPPSGSNSRLS